MNWNNSLEDYQLFEEKEEVQVEMVQLDEEDERMKCERERADQCRSRFAMVRRKLNKNNEFTRWVVGMKKPKEFGGGTIQIRYDTDVEAAVAASVIARVLGKPLPDPENADWPSLKCHDYLIECCHSPLPDCSNNESIKEFVNSCLKFFKNIVESVENKTMPMPEDTAMADAIGLYWNSVHYDQKYKEGEVPALKQSRPGENKRKRNVVESD